jgi:ribulose-5-phosphate 4-epimerase/fuculose-1-phosphate aldolase
VTLTTAQPSQVAQANRILAALGILDAFGHASVRLIDDPDHFLLARNMAPALVQPDDVQVFDLDGVTDDERRPYLERFIHAEIYRARPDVQAVVHTHSAALIPFAASTDELRPIYHMAGFLAKGVARFEIRDIAGPETDLLIRNSALGAHLAASLGDAPFVLMRGHGAVAVAESLELAVYRAVYADKNALLQMQAAALGNITFLTPEEGKAAAATNAGQVQRAYQVWQELAG